MRARTKGRLFRIGALALVLAATATLVVVGISLWEDVQFSALGDHLTPE
jgi:hypothetical protein